MPETIPVESPREDRGQGEHLYRKHLLTHHPCPHVVVEAIGLVWNVKDRAKVRT